jgi:hypothetical protein
VYARRGYWAPQARAQVYLFDEDTGERVAAMQADQEGLYQFLVPTGSYVVMACVVLDQVSYRGARYGLTPPDPYADVFLLKGPCT